MFWKKLSCVVFSVVCLFERVLCAHDTHTGHFGTQATGFLQSGHSHSRSHVRIPEKSRASVQTNQPVHLMSLQC